MNDKDITKVVEQIIKHLDDREWSQADRLQLVLQELTKIKVAELESAKL